MTGEDGDPFRKGRWHWPSKRRDFEKNLLITKHAKIADFATFFSFTLEKCRKSTFFLGPPRRFYRLLRPSISTVHSSNFRFFWGVRNVDFFAIFSISGTCQKVARILPEPGFRPARSRSQTCQNLARNLPGLATCQNLPDLPESKIFAIFWIFAIFHDFRDFRDFSGFSRFLWFLRFLTISDRSWHVQKVEILDTSDAICEVSKSWDFWHVRCRVSSLDSVQSDHYVGGFDMQYFMVFLCTKKWENISLWPQPPL